MWLWIVLVVLAVMAALLIYAACCVDGDIDRQSEAHPDRLDTLAAIQAYKSAFGA